MDGRKDLLRHPAPGFHGAVDRGKPGVVSALVEPLGHTERLAGAAEGGRALGLTTTASFLGTVIGMLCLVAFAPLIAEDEAARLAQLDGVG